VSCNIAKNWGVFSDDRRFEQVGAYWRNKIILNYEESPCGHDSEGGRTHIHPIDEPELHIFTDEKTKEKEIAVPQLPTPYFAHPYPMQKHFTGREKERTEFDNFLHHSIEYALKDVIPINR
jgi:hypothetical protein